MPAFSFEKIEPPAQLETAGPISSTVRRGAIARFLDRLTSARARKSEGDSRKTQTPKQKRRKQG
jgi:hypothetical protein